MPFYLAARVPYGSSNKIPDNQRLGVLVGASYTLHNDRFWLRITPNYVFSNTEEGLFRSGIPLADIGMKLTPSLDLSLGLCLMPIMVSWVF
jgi:hypothetical protein